MTAKPDIARVAVEKAAYHYDRLFDYRVPPELAGKVQPGSRVTLPFGKGNQKRCGVVLEMADDTDNANIKPLLAALDEAPLLSREFIQLVAWLKEHTYCTYYEAAKLLWPTGMNVLFRTSYCLASPLPEADWTQQERALLEKVNQSGEITSEELTRLWGTDGEALAAALIKKGGLTLLHRPTQKIRDAVIRMAKLTAPLTGEEKLTLKQRQVADFLSGVPDASIKEITYFTGVGEGVVKTLAQKGFVTLFDGEVYRDPYRALRPGVKEEALCLTDEQQAAFEGMREQLFSGKGSAALLYGVTGSGKTQVYLKLIDETLAAGRQAIVMVPEISLTPQTIAIFHRRYGSRVAVLHSGLSAGERLDEWKRLKRGEASIAVGTRSAVFAPLQNLGLIILDEEHEQTYKSEKTPRYHARDVARFRCTVNNALLLLASATPSVESYAAAQSGRYRFYTLTRRYGSALLPQVVVADMTDELPSGNRGAIGRLFRGELQATFEEHKQSIILLNRRGYQTYASCVDCRQVITCPHCSISLIYHAANRRLMCHYCGYSTHQMTCPDCKGQHLRFSGFGTQWIEEELQSVLPQAKILRLDADTTMTKMAFEKKLKLFAQGAYDVLLGTQMVAKGLDFERVTLVGVVSVDGSLFDADYRASERTFSLLTQVVGRSGRGEHPGKAVIQTFYPDNPVIQLAAAQDYPAFYQNEIALRRLMTYPPYCDLCVVEFTASDQALTERAAGAFLSALRKKNKEVEAKLIVLGPSPARVMKVSDQYRYHLTVKCKNDKMVRGMMAELYTAFQTNREYNGVRVAIDHNPYHGS